MVWDEISCNSLSSFRLYIAGSPLFSTWPFNIHSKRGLLVVSSKLLFLLLSRFVESDMRIIVLVHSFVHADFRIGVLDFIGKHDETSANERTEGI